MHLNLYGDPLITMTDIFYLTQQSKKKFKALPQEEQDQILAKRESDKEYKRVKACIQQGKCPHCLGKLIRGKKDKKNNYLRTWKCSDCEKEINN